MLKLRGEVGMKKIGGIILALVVLGIGIAIVGCGSSSGDGKLIVGVMYNGDTGDGGWSYAHEQGVAKAADNIGEDKIQIITQKNVPDGPDCVQTMEALISKGAKVIVGTSFDYMDYMLEEAEKNPDVIFLHCSGYKTSENMSTYFAKIEESEYLAGLVAGMETKTNTIGYVAPVPIPEVVRMIDGFTLGVRKTNPDAIVKVVWTNSWFDPQKEKDSANALMNVGCDIIAQFQNTPGPMKAAQEGGAKAVGIYTDMSVYAPDAVLTSALVNWDIYYTKIFKEIMDGQYKTEEFNGDLADGSVDIFPLNTDIISDSDKVQKVVDQERDALLNDTKNVFDGPIKNQAGEIVVPEGETLSDSDVLSIYFLVEGVEGELPPLN